jgi:AcrR family transcriptional regulator
MGLAERRQRDKENVRKKILDAALQLAIAEGWDAVTIRKIADTIEYSPPVVYDHFENKDALINELVLIGCRKLREKMHLDDQTETNPKTVLQIISLGHWSFAFENKALYQLMFSPRKKMPNQEMFAIFLIIKELFKKLTNNYDNNQYIGELIFNWMCLQNGIIFSVMQMGLPPDLQKEDPKALFTRSVERFFKNF